MAFAASEASLLAPFNYVKLLWVSILGYLVFGDVPEAFPLDLERPAWQRVVFLDEVDEGVATINPLGNTVGAIIMFFVLGFVPAWIVAKILDAAGVLRVPREVELMGLDFRTLHEEEEAREDVRRAEKALA